MIRRPPRSTPLYSSAASDVYKRQGLGKRPKEADGAFALIGVLKAGVGQVGLHGFLEICLLYTSPSPRASQDLVCRLLLENKKTTLTRSGTRLTTSCDRRNSCYTSP